jgi:hypothetical protein
VATIVLTGWALALAATRVSPGGPLLLPVPGGVRPFYAACLLPDTVQLCINCRRSPAGFWVSRNRGGIHYCEVPMIKEVASAAIVQAVTDAYTNLSSFPWGPDMRPSIADGNFGKDVAEARQWPLLTSRADPLVADGIRYSGVS